MKMNKILYSLLVITLVIGMISAYSFLEDADESDNSSVVVPQNKDAISLRMMADGDSKSLQMMQDVIVEEENTGFFASLNSLWLKVVGGLNYVYGSIENFFTGNQKSTIVANVRTDDE